MLRVCTSVSTTFAYSDQPRKMRGTPVRGKFLNTMLR